MNTPFALCMRLTHGYQARYSYLEKSHNMGECQVIAGRERKWDRHGESFRQLLILSVNTGSTPYRQRNIIRAIEDTMEFGGCACSHDCCGHISGGARKVRPLGGHRYAVIMSGSRNC
jgi:hypothetical protein